MKPTEPRLVFALDLVAETNAMIRAAFDARQHVTTEKSANDFATETDAAVEALIAERIAGAFPGDTLLGEEGGARALGDAPSTGVRWIVDQMCIRDSRDTAHQRRGHAHQSFSRR